VPTGRCRAERLANASLSLNRRRRQSRARSGGYHSPVNVGADGNDSDNRVRCDMGAKLPCDGVLHVRDTAQLGTTNTSKKLGNCGGTIIFPKRASMCDYSMHLVSSRPAKAGDQLITTSFPGTTTRGFAAVDGPAVAVCLLPGTELAFENHVAWRRPFFGLFQKQRLRGKLARFRQVNTEYAQRHHDAIEFPDGTIVLLTDLRQGSGQSCCSCRPRRRWVAMTALRRVSRMFRPPMSCRPERICSNKHSVWCVE
jgi:hypothetical protein